MFQRNKQPHSLFSKPLQNKYFDGFSLSFKRLCSTSLSIVCIPLEFTYELLGLKDVKHDPFFKRLSMYDLISIFVIVAIKVAKRLNVDIVSSSLNLFSYPVMMLCLLDFSFRSCFRNLVSSLRVWNLFPYGIVLAMSIFQTYHFGDKCSHSMGQKVLSLSNNVEGVRDYLLHLLYCSNRISIIKDKVHTTVFNHEELLEALMTGTYKILSFGLSPISSIGNVAVTRLLFILNSDNRLSMLIINQAIALIIVITNCLLSANSFFSYDKVVSVLVLSLSKFCTSMNLKVSPIDFSDDRSSDLGIYSFSFLAMPATCSGLYYSATAGMTTASQGALFYFACIMQPSLVGANIGNVCTNVGLSNGVVISCILTPSEFIMESFITCLFADSDTAQFSSSSMSRPSAPDTKPTSTTNPIASSLVTPTTTIEPVDVAKSSASSTVNAPKRPTKVVAKGAKSAKVPKGPKVQKEASN